jgi:hypothetical protein
MEGFAGVTLLLTELAIDVPFAFVAVTVNVYAVPFVNPVNIYGELDVVCVVVAGLDVIEYPVIAEPPVAPAVIVIVAVVFPDAAEIVGACGTVVAVTALLAELAADVLAPFDAVTVYVYPVDD